MYKKYSVSRPDGQLICPELDEEEIFYELTDDEECVEDPNVRFLVRKTQEKTAIKSARVKSPFVDF